MSRKISYTSHLSVICHPQIYGKHLSQLIVLEQCPTSVIDIVPPFHIIASNKGRLKFQKEFNESSLINIFLQIPYKFMDFPLQLRNFPVGSPYSLQDPVFPYSREIPLRVGALHMTHHMSHNDISKKICWDAFKICQYLQKSPL